MLRNMWYRDKAWLHQVYMLECKSQRDIAKMCGCSYPTISKWMKRHGIPARSVSEGMILYRRRKLMTSGSLPGAIHPW